jgi:type II secretory pathway component PulJ
MKLFKNLFYLIVLPSLLAFSCNKGDEASDATITFGSPTDNDTLTFGQELHIEGTIKGNGVLEGYTFSVKNLTNGSYIKPETTVSEHSEDYVFHEHWDNNVSDTSTIEIKVEALLNHEGEKKTKTVTVVCLPQ